MDSKIEMPLRRLGGKLGTAMITLVKEYESALRKHPKPFTSMHQGYAVILEELDETWDVIKRKGSDKAAIKAEIQAVGAMVLRFMVDLL